MISFIIFYVGWFTAFGSFFVGILYIQNLILEGQEGKIIEMKKFFPDFGIDINLLLGIVLVILSPIIGYFIKNWYKRMIITEIRRGWWKYITITGLQMLSGYIIYRSLDSYYHFYSMINAGIILLFTLFLFIQIGLYNDYHGKKKFFKNLI